MQWLAYFTFNMSHILLDGAHIKARNFMSSYFFQCFSSIRSLGNGKITMRDANQNLV